MTARFTGRAAYLLNRLIEGAQALNDRQRAVLRARFLEGQSLEEIGEGMGRSRERARQIEKSALDKLFRPRVVIKEPQKLTDFTHLSPEYTEIERSALNNRTKAILLRAGIFDWDTVRKLSDEQLLKKRNLGAKALAEIRAVSNGEPAPHSLPVVAKVHYGEYLLPASTSVWRLPHERGVKMACGNLAYSTSEATMDEEAVTCLLCRRSVLYISNRRQVSA